MSCLVALSRCSKRSLLSWSMSLATDLETDGGGAAAGAGRRHEEKKSQREKA
jgi:hypothetical protein